MTIGELVAFLEKNRESLRHNGSIVQGPTRGNRRQWLLKFRVRIAGEWRQRTLTLGQDPVKLTIADAFLTQYRRSLREESKVGNRNVRPFSPAAPAGDSGSTQIPMPTPSLASTRETAGSTMEMLRQQFREDVRAGRPSRIPAAWFIKDPSTGPLDPDEFREYQRQDQEYRRHASSRNEPPTQHDAKT